ncbi:peptidase M16 [Rhodobacteraceae bacterium WD3A24]|nr:peptidase M16 [Rhodobacteraceae bacterium WD3A24]
MMKRLFFALAAAVTLALPARAAVEITELTSPGGIDAWLAEDHSLPFTAIEIRFRGGAALDPDGAEGAVHLMTALLEEGSNGMDAQGFAATLEGLGARLDFDSSHDTVAVSARFLTENRGESAELLRAALTEPSFAPVAVERVRGQVLSGLRSDARDPNAIASRRFAELAFGDHPYATPAEGTMESVADLSRDDLIAAHEAALARDRVYVSAVGDITPDALGALIDSVLGELPTTGAPMPEPADIGLTGGLTVVPFEGPQSVVTFGHKGIARDDPDFMTAYLMIEVLGGGRFGTRLMHDLREERGLTYGVRSYLVPRDLASTIRGGFSSRNEYVAQAIGLVREEWARMAEEGLTEQELDEVKTYMTGAYPLRFDGNAQIARIMVGMQLDDMPVSYIEERNDMVRDVTLDDIRRVAQRLLDPEGLHFVVVGQPEGMEPGG